MKTTTVDDIDFTDNAMHVVLADGTELTVKIGQQVAAALAGMTLKANTTNTPQGYGMQSVSANQTNAALGTGAVGDYLHGILLIPGLLALGVCSVKDGSGTAVAINAGITVNTLAAIWIPLGVKSKSGGWKISTALNVSAIAIGNFTA